MSKKKRLIGLLYIAVLCSQGSCRRAEQKYSNVPDGEGSFRGSPQSRQSTKTPGREHLAFRQLLGQRQAVEQGFWQCHDSGHAAFR